MSLKRKKTEEEEPDNMKMPRTMFQQLGRLRKILRHEDQRKRMNQWPQKNKVRQMSKLLDLPLSAVRLHRSPRKKMQELPKEEKKRRITMMLLKEPGKAMVVDESKEDMKRPKKKSSVAWRGRHELFVRERREHMKQPDVGQEAYVQLGHETFKCGKKYQQVLLLKLKASRTELVPSSAIQIPHRSAILATITGSIPM